MGDRRRWANPRLQTPRRQHRQTRSRPYAALFYNSIVTHIPFHFIRLNYLRLFGATIGKGSALNRGTTVWSIPYIVIGENVAIGFRCLLDARAGIAIGNDVVIASDTQIIAGGHDVNHPNFVPAPNPPDPVVIDDYVWIASRAMILPCLIGRGAVVAAQSVVNKEVPPFADRRRDARESHRRAQPRRAAVLRQVQDPVLLIGVGPRFEF